MGHFGRVISISVLFLMIAITSLSGPASAHSPEFPSGNNSLDNAWEVHDPGKSWALYCSLPEGEDQYYRMNFQSGDRILLNLIVPVDEGKRGFLPEMALLGPGMAASGDIPDRIDVPSGYGYTVIAGSIPEEPTFEAFAPGSYYQISDLDLVAGQTGEYYVAIWESEQSPGIGGEYGFP
ncbi:MAG TPA: hypothetical protein VLH13_04210, partial [Methanomassiliicoccales archaeon]|nr:hypothetical protein [Methanomassiliicoccales archaeon]